MNRILQALFFLPVLIVTPVVANMARGQESAQVIPTTIAPVVVTPSPTAVPAPTTTTSTLPDLSGVDFGALQLLAEEQERAVRQQQIIEARRAYGKCGEWHDLALSVGWPADQWPTLSYVLYRESRCNIDSWNQSDPATGSRGLMQINGFWCRPNRYDPNGFLQSVGVLNSCEDLFNPELNLRAGLAIWNYGQDEYGCGWRGPWATPCNKYSTPEAHPGI